jgi:hypothetical protein
VVEGGARREEGRLGSKEGGLGGEGGGRWRWERKERWDLVPINNEININHVIS